MMRRLTVYAAPALAAPALAVLLLGAALELVADDSYAGKTFDPRRVSWTRLELEAKKLIFTARSVVHLRTVAAAEASAEWIKAPRGTVVGPAGEMVHRVRIETSGAGSESTDSVWFNPRRADALQRLKMKHGKKGYRKAARFTDEGVFVLRTAPIDRTEAEKPYSKWTKVEEFFYPLPGGAGCRTISEPSVLFYMLSASNAASEALCVFSNKQIIPLEIETMGTEQLEVSYTEVQGESSEERGGSVEVLRIAVRPIEGDQEFELMGLEGAVEILLEKASRVPLEVRGKIGGLGRVRIKLTSVELRSGA